MARPKPQNPQALAATVAILRAHAKDGSADSPVARRLVDRFDRINPSIRRDGLGAWFDKTVVLEPGGAATTSPGRGSSRSRILADQIRATTTVRPGVRAGTAVLEPATGTATGGGTGPTAAGGPTRVAIDWSRFDDLVVFPLTATTYAIDYVGFVCEDETSWDGFSNSDEVYVITSAASVNPDGTNVVRTEKHPISGGHYKDVDRGEERIGPEARCYQGTQLPVSLTVIAFEHDYGDPNKYRDEIDAIVKAAILAATHLLGLGAGAAAILASLSGTITDAINWLFDTGDDQIDRDRTYVLDQATFDQLGTHSQGYHFYGSPLKVTGLFGHLFSTHSGSGARYTFGFRVSRDPAYVVDPGPIL